MGAGIVVDNAILYRRRVDTHAGNVVRYGTVLDQTIAPENYREYVAREEGGVICYQAVADRAVTVLYYRGAARSIAADNTIADRGMRIVSIDGPIVGDRECENLSTCIEDIHRRRTARNP